MENRRDRSSKTTSWWHHANWPSALLTRRLVVTVAAFLMVTIWISAGTINTWAKPPAQDDANSEANHIYLPLVIGGGDASVGSEQGAPVFNDESHVITEAVTDVNANAPTLDEGTVDASAYCSTYINFSNQSNQLVYIYWINWYGQEVYYNYLYSGYYYWQQTYYGHEWVVRDNTGRQIKRLTANSCYYIYATIYNSDFPQPTATPRPTNTATPRPTNTPTATAVPPTATAVPPTATAVPPTATAVPPTATTIPSTSVPSFRSLDGSVVSGSYANGATPNRPLLRSWYSPSLNRTIRTSTRYADGIAAPFDVPAFRPRLISNQINAQASSIPEPTGLSDMVWQWGQFLDHDLDLTTAHKPSEAFPILVPAGDSHFDPNGTGTVQLSFMRSIYDPTSGTSVINPRNQLNQITAWIDGSQIYGISAQQAQSLRTGNGGKLKTSAGNLLPFDPNAPSQFLAGDIRANEQIGLTSLHTLFMREHNRLADYVAGHNPNAEDEYLYQMARQFVGAELQTVTYQEFLPILLGNGALPAYTGHRDDIDPGISSIFSTAAYRFGHSMLPDTLWRLDRSGREIANGHVALRDAFFHPDLVVQDGIEPILYGLTRHSPQRVDLYLIDDVRNFLIPNANDQRVDLAATNIQRGRDHGIASYTKTRASIGLSTITDFSQIGTDGAIQAALADTYGDIRDIDLWVGGLAEAPVNGGLVGETFHTIIVDQFTRLRDADPFWYSTIDWPAYDRSLDQNPVVHSDGTRLSQVTLAKIIEWNTSYQITRSAFRR